MKERYQALYRVLRPLTFDDMVGQTVIRKTLKNQVKTGRIGHAYLFCGSRGTGKTSAAKIFSRAVNCLDPRDGDPCCECASCKSILNDTSLDVLEIDAASNSSVENIRQLIEQVVFPPQAEKYKVYIIDEVHMLSGNAFNALLKTLEEPPEHVVFILATTDPQKVPVTILSRCQRFDFSRLSMDDLLTRLKMAVSTENARAEDNALYLIAQAADGGMRDALSILDTCLGMTDDITVQDVRNVLGTAGSDLIDRVTAAASAFDGAEALRCVDAGILKGMDAQVFLTELCRRFRQLLTAHLCGPDADLLKTTPDEAAQLHAAALKFTLPHLERCLTTLMRAESDTRYSASPRGVLEVALLRACDRVQEHDLTALQEQVSELTARLQELEKTGVRVQQPSAAADNADGPPAEKKERPITLPKTTDLTGDEIWNAMIRNIRANRSLYSLISLGIRFGGRSGSEYTIVLPAGDAVPLQIFNGYLDTIREELAKAGAAEPKLKVIRENTEDEKQLKRQIMSSQDMLINVFGRDKVVITD